VEAPYIVLKVRHRYIGAAGLISVVTGVRRLRLFLAVCQRQCVGRTTLRLNHIVLSAVRAVTRRRCHSKVFTRVT